MLAQGSQHRLCQRDIEQLTRARVVLDAIYDSLMALNLSVKPILVQQLREVHAIVFALEQKGARPILREMVKHGLLKPSELPEWFLASFPPPAPAAAEKSEEQS
jgi:hypothetical protein